MDLDLDKGQMCTSKEGGDPMGKFGGMRVGGGQQHRMYSSSSS